jgi:cellulose synthase/poly-beta-1,6-N-acetylglucosamine synthase-like glycosyltransferase
MILIDIFAWIFLLYFLGLNGGYLILNIFAGWDLWKSLAQRDIESAVPIYSGLEPPISILVPAYNEEATIAASLRSQLQLSYADYEIVVVNDGSKDNTMQVLIDEFRLVLTVESSPNPIETKPVKAIYRSELYKNLRVVDKVNGGKADALNVGINNSRSPYFCCIDADSILTRDSMQALVQPFLDDATTIASGGTIRVANGCEVRSGFLARADLPRNPLALLQIVEYLRAFLFGRLGWSPFNALLIISGAFGLFDREKVIKAGGYLHATIGEDMELVVRMHKMMRDAGTPYKIAFVADPMCWTEAPEDLKTLRNQRVRWQRGLCESLMKNRGLLFHPKGGIVSWVAFPFMLIFEMYGPLFEFGGLIFMLVTFAFGFLPDWTVFAFFLLSVGLGLLLSISSLLLEELTFHIYPKPRHILTLIGVAIAENLGYRQLNSYWRIKGLYLWMRGKQATWGEMKRKATWNKT